MADDLQPDAPSEVTAALNDWNHGDPSTLERLLPLVYDELRRLARQHLSHESPSLTLQPTELVHEAFLRLWGQERPNWRNRAYFFGAASEVMRRILVDLARRRKAGKRGGTLIRVDLAEADIPVGERDFDLETLDSALVRLAQLDPRQARLVEIRFFGGLTIEHSAEVLGISPATVKREWLLAKAWLLREISRQP